MPEYKDDKSTRTSRIEALKKDGIEVTMPECDAEYLIAYFYEVGPVTSGNMGESSLTHTELRSWMNNTGIELESWEARTMIRLSKEYLSESHKATKPHSPAPWADAPYITSHLMAKRLQQQLMELMKL